MVPNTAGVAKKMLKKQKRGLINFLTGAWVVQWMGWWESNQVICLGPPYLSLCRQFKNFDIRVGRYSCNYAVGQNKPTMFVQQSPMLFMSCFYML